MKTKTIQFEKRDAGRDIGELYTINNVAIENVESIKYLGVYFDRKLNFSIHANDVESRTMKLVNAAARLANYMEHRKLNATLYEIYTDPINYAASSCYTNYKNLRTKVERGHHRMTRCALRIPYRTDIPGYMTYDRRCIRLNKPTVTQRNTYLIAIMLSKIILGKADCSLRSRIMETRDTSTNRRAAAEHPIFNLVHSRIDKSSPLGRMLEIGNKHLGSVDIFSEHLPVLDSLCMKLGWPIKKQYFIRLK